MPIKPNKDWNVDPDTHSEYVWRIGNLTLLGGEYNKKIVNSSFDKKKRIYQKSDVHITNMIIDYDNWGPNEISDRQKKMAKIALDIWKL